MNYIGTIVEESLSDKSILKELTILKTNVIRVTSRQQTPWLTQWTVHNFSIPKERADTIAELLSWSIDPTHPQWYVAFKNEVFHYIVFNGQVFKIDVTHPEQYDEAVNYGIGIGIPEGFLHFV
jgi:uncharacterized phage-associated protein